MIFNSLTFVVFFATVLASYASIRSWSGRKLLLICASYLFYAAWNPPFVLLLAMSTVVDWWLARRLAASQSGSRRRLLVMASIAVNLGVLGGFKYGNFAVENLQALLASMGIEYTPAVPSIVLPVGISFYTFQTLSYTLDVYRRKIPASASLLDFGLFVSFFPQLVAGPIVRASEFLPQCAVERRISAKPLGWGLFLITLGLFQKSVLADTLLAPTVEWIFFVERPMRAFDAWIAVLGFSGQIYCDFAGYSTCAVGAAMCLGFSLPQNFRSPYISVGFRDFWRRWHITLSTWLRDYLYIPLGGSRRGRWRTVVALFVTMVLGGLWHGASWNFVVWGLLHGVFLVSEHQLSRMLAGRRWPSHPSIRVLRILATFVLVSMTWVFFRERDLGMAIVRLESLIGFHDSPPILPSIFIARVLVPVVAMLGLQWYMRDRCLESVVESQSVGVITAIWGVMLAAVVLSLGVGDAFIYFQF